MAKKVITQKRRVSVAKKRWYSVHAPKAFNEIMFAETLAEEAESLIGRTIKTNLGSVLKVGKKQNLEVRFRIVDLKGNNCETELVSLELLPPHVKRVVKRAKKRVDDSFVVETKEGVKVRVKPMLLVKDNVQHSLLTSLRMKGREFVEKEAKELAFNEFVNKVVVGDLFRDLKIHLKKVYPVTGIELRALVKL
jgi:ribosomal protein S3AE